MNAQFYDITHFVWVFLNGIVIAYTCVIATVLRQLGNN